MNSEPQISGEMDNKHKMEESDGEADVDSTDFGDEVDEEEKRDNSIQETSDNRSAVSSGPELGLVSGDKDKKETSNRSGSATPVSNELEVFRQQWHEELQQRPGSRGHSQSPHNNHREATQANKAKQANDKENEARAYFIQGMEAEDDGMLTEAIFYYRKALQLVPDIESRLGNVFTQSPRDRVRQDSESSMEESELDEDLVVHLEQLRLKEEALCQPEYEQKMTHISCLPVELIVYILHWVVSNDLDLRSLEMFSLVCRGFYLCAREERVWKKACAQKVGIAMLANYVIKTLYRVWGVNLGSSKKYGGSWRKMMIERPHLLFDGCYISKVTYVRQGEQGMDSFYRPFHMVEYYRYVRFFPDGQVLMLVSPEDPIQSLPKLKYRNSRASGILKGGYRLSDLKVTCVLKREKTELQSYRYKRHRQAANQNDVDMSYAVEFDVVSHKRRTNAQLVWSNYAIEVKKSAGEEAVTNVDLNQRSFPPLFFSRVRSYAAASTEPLV